MDGAFRRHCGEEQGQFSHDIRRYMVFRLNTSVRPPRPRWLRKMIVCRNLIANQNLGEMPLCRLRVALCILFSVVRGDRQISARASCGSAKATVAATKADRGLLHSHDYPLR
jgi:hypothetical protein